MKLKAARRIVQLASIALLIAIPVLNKQGIDIIMGSLYSLAIGPVWITDPLSGLQAIITILSADTTLIISISIPILFTLIFGRVFCSWMCPQNLLSEVADYFSQKVPLKRFIKLSPNPLPRYAVLAIVLVLTLLADFPVANLISAPGIISVQVSEYIFTGMVGIEIALIAAILVFEIFVIRRAWCNYICPVGGFLGIFRTPKTMNVAFENTGDRCIKCGECVKSCQLGLNPMGGKIYPICHNCGDCIAACGRATGKDRPLKFKF